MSFKDRYTTNSSDSGTSKNPTENRVDNLLPMIFNANTTSALLTLEEYRKSLSNLVFRSLLLSLTTELNNPTWTQRVQTKDRQLRYRNDFAVRTKQQLPTDKDTDRCLLTVLYYIVSVIQKYNIIDDSLWTQILQNSKTRTIEFYRFLYKMKILIPEAVCTYFSHDQMSSMFLSAAPKDKIKLILLGFTYENSRARCMQIKHCENLFIELKRQQVLNNNVKPQQLIHLMVTPEQLSLFLSYFSDYDLNTMNPTTNHTILDQIIDMKPYFYIVPEGEDNEDQVTHYFTRHSTIAQRNTDGSKLGSSPNEITKYRAARILNLFRSVILQGAQFSKPVYSNISDKIINEFRFFTTSIGIYALIGLRMDDIDPSESSFERDSLFVSTIIKIAKSFPSEFEDFILHHLKSSYSIIHKREFIIEQRRKENIQTQKINDKLFQTSLTLKEWCRLKIKDVCPQKDIKKFNLSNSLSNYCSFDLLNSNYAINCITEITEHKGNIMPTDATVENVTNYWPETDDNEEMIENDNDTDENSVNSFDESDEHW